MEFKNDVLVTSFLLENTSIEKTHQIGVLHESVVKQITDETLDKVFDTMYNKYQKIDFGAIEQTRGDITRFKYYNGMEESIKQLELINKENGGLLPEAQILRETLMYVTNYKDEFRRAFSEHNKYIEIIYNTMVLSLFQAVSHVIATTIDFSRNANDEMELSIYRNRGRYGMMVIDNLKAINGTFKDGSMRKYFKSTKPGNTINESIGDTFRKLATGVKPGDMLGAASSVMGISNPIVAGAAIIYAGIKILPFIKELLYRAYNSVQKISDAAKVQADFLETNIEMVQRSEKYGEQKKAKIVSKQSKFVQFFRKIQSKFMVASDNADKKTRAELQREPKLDINAEDYEVYI